jgi:Zn-dependent membrane protease YugP
MDMLLFYVIGGLVALFSFGVRQKMKSTYAKWSRVRSETGRPGGQVARIILDSNNLHAVGVDPVQGVLTDHYDPARKHIRLAQENFFGNSVAATAVSAHECGHALQDATGYGPLKLRNAAIPVANAGARFGLPLAIFGGLFGSPTMVHVGILAYLGSMLVTFVTLPVEFNASKRALNQLESLRLVSGKGIESAEEVLRAAAMTYVASVVTSAGYLIYIVIAGGRMLLGRPKLPPGPLR